jgi:serine/threonine protein kinase
MSIETTGVLKFVDEQCRVIVSTAGDGDAGLTIKSVFGGVPDLPKLRADIESHRALLEKLGKSYCVQIANAIWGSNELEIQFERVLGTSFTTLAPLSDAASASLLVQLIDSLEKLHEVGIWSGWLDPRLVYLNEKKVSLALVLPLALQSRSAKHEIHRGFIAPEFYDSSMTLDSRSDVYGVGAIGFYLLTGLAPPASNLEEILAEATKSLELRAIIEKCLSLNPDNRYHSVGDVVEALESAKLIDTTLDKPSLVVLNTQEKGQVFLLSEGVNTIGSDLQSTIRLPELAPNVAIIERSNLSTIVKICSDQSCKVNSKSIAGGQTRAIKRGAVLEFTPYRLRYLSANEIYSPQVETEFDGTQTKSQKLFKKLGFMLTGVALLGLGVSVISKRQNEEIQSAKEKQSRIAMEAKLASFIWTGDFYLRSFDSKGSCSSDKCTKECSTAVDCFSQALALDPSDTYTQARFEQAQRMVPETVAVDTSVQDRSPEFNLLEKAKNLIAAGNLFCEEGECAEQLINQALELNSLNSESQDLLTELAAESIHRIIKARAEGNYSELEINYQISIRLGVSSQYIAPLKVGLDVIKKSTSPIVIIDEHEKEDEAKKSTSRISNAALAEKLSVRHGYKLPESARRVLDISSFDK